MEDHASSDTASAPSAATQENVQPQPPAGPTEQVKEQQEEGQQQQQQQQQQQVLEPPAEQEHSPSEKEPEVTTPPRPSVADPGPSLAEVGLKVGSWFGGRLKNTANFLQSRGKEMIETVTPEIKEFAQQLQSDTSQFVAKQKERLMHVAAQFDEAFESQGEGQEASPAKQAAADRARKATGSSTKQEGEEEAQRETDGDPQPPAGKPTRKLPKAYEKNFSARFISKLEALREDESTFTTDPPEPPHDTPHRTGTFQDYPVDQYEVLEWCHDETIATLKERLVPSRVDEELFWKRFLYRIYLLKCEEAHLADLVQRVKNTETGDEEEEFSWDDVDSPRGHPDKHTHEHPSSGGEAEGQHEEGTEQPSVKQPPTPIRLTPERLSQGDNTQDQEEAACEVVDSPVGVPGASPDGPASSGASDDFAIVQPVEQHKEEDNGEWVSWD